ncbi:hypothetical protein WR25_10998 isoform C [Diploscapter pachys]|uniref:OTU domain-containing protein n=1 Tax=Diploscapter pachys TaxID=2018661 RepID=A0A2A2LRS1_9BILA|nr:hypothetical protein WR25_10998 isoform C [Diploscapter pachys]
MRASRGVKMSDEPMPTSTNPISKTSQPSSNANQSQDAPNLHMPAQNFSNSRLTEAETEQRRQEFMRKLKSGEFKRAGIIGDGNCFFRSIEMYRAFVDGGKLEENLTQMEKNGTYAADAEIRAMTTICNRPIEVFHDDSEYLIVYADDKVDANEKPLRLYFVSGNRHYEAVIETGENGDDAVTAQAENLFENTTTTNLLNENATNANKSNETGQNPVVPDIIKVQIGEAIERKALGRVAELGQFYDARTEQFIRGKIFTRNLPLDAVKVTTTLPMVPPNFECVTNETLHERLEKLHVEPELKASIICEMVDLSGHGEYLLSDTAKTGEASSTLIYVKPTKNEMVKFDNPVVASTISPNSVQDIPEATHVLVGIQWGIAAAVTLKCDKTNPNDISIENDLKDYKSNLRTQLYQIIADIRNGKPDSHQRLDEIMNEYHQNPASPTNFNSVIEPFAPLNEKIEFVSRLLHQGVVYVNKDGAADRIREKDRFDECYIFFCEWNNTKDIQGNSWYFNALAKGRKCACLFVDSISQPEIAKNEGVPAGNRICLYSNKTYESVNYYGDYLEDQKKCYVKCKMSRASSSKLDMSSRRVEVDLICPQSMKGDFCSKDVREWYCADCRERLQYDFKRNFHCECGHAPVNTFLFRCSDPNHKVDFIGFDDNCISSLVDKIQPYKEINILILGETGVGKSTWINGLSNYLTYSTLGDAEHGKQIYLVPSQFTITDSNRRLKKITVGKSKNETHDDGASSTQHPKSYVFNVGKKSVRLIDTPGIGDTRDADVDDKNLAEILKFIAQFDEIHGICILLKPNNARLNLMFRYCISELLTHLDVTAAANIAFCFTNARGTFYRPGDTMPALNTYLEKLKSDQGVKISTKADRVYCMDNESFRFLCCLHAGEYFSDEEKKNFEQSWNLSVQETNRLLDHFENHVEPHVVARTVSLNSARELILTLAKPLADISQIIQDNIAAMNEKAEEVQALNVRKDDLMKKLMILQIGLQPKELGFPQTVCTGVNCIKTETLPNTETQKTIYKTICHERCYIQGVTPGTVPNTALQHCTAMDKSLKCTKCKCSWDLHMHITHTQEKIEILVEYSDIQMKLKNTNSDKEAQEIIVKTYQDRINKYKAEQSAIDEACAKFAAFLNKHAIIAYNDAVEDYLKFNIREAEQVVGTTGSKKSSKRVERLEQQLRQYIEKKRILSSQLANGTAQLIDASDIQKIQKKLEKLELTGPNIKLLFDATVNGKEVNLVQQELYFNRASYQKKRRPRRPYIPPPGYDSSENGHETDSGGKNKDRGKSDFQKVKDWVKLHRSEAACVMLTRYLSLMIFILIYLLLFIKQIKLLSINQMNGVGILCEWKRENYMAEKSSRSAGWRFQSSRKEQLHVIEFHSQSDPFDQDTLNSLTDRVQELDGDDVSLCFKFLPAIDQLISQIPFTLPLLEVLYLKCELAHAEEGTKFSSKELMCEQLFCQLVWWTAFSEQMKNTGSISRKKLPKFEDVEPCIVTLVGILHRQLPDLIERAQADRRQLTACLESLGCHGLVNCSTGLIRMSDAVHLEVSRHIDKLKVVNSKIRDLHDENKNSQGKQTNPSVASHQRQMSLKLSEVFERLKHNEAVEVVLDDVLTNHHVSRFLYLFENFMTY